MRAILMVCIVALPVGAIEAAPQDSSRPNIVFIMADDLGYGDLGCFGQEQIQTPRLDALASQGMRCTSAYAGSTVCAPSRCVLMTGKHTGHAIIRGNGTMPLPEEEVTLAEVLKDQGYATAMFGKWGLGNPGDSGEPTRQGFDEYFGYLHQGHAHNYYPEFLFRNGEKVMLDNVVPNATKSGAGKASAKNTYSHDLFIEESLRFIDQHHEEPFFLYLPLTIPHANNEAGNEGMEVPDLGAYAGKDWPEPQKGTAAMITRMDTGVGRILDRLQKYGITENTIVVFTSDNGPHREGGNNPDFFDSNGPLQGIKRSLHDGGIRVPTIVCWPGRVPAGSTSDTPWMFADILPTLAQAAGGQVPPGIDGVSVLATWQGEDQDLSGRTLYWEFPGGGFKQAARRGKWKVVRHTSTGTPIQLYDLSSDIGEMNDRASEHPEIVAEFEEFFASARTPSKRWPGKFPATRAPIE
jgi:arylsulfatase A-like enzyme